MSQTHLTEYASISTSGARAVEPFDLDGMSLLAIPQLAYDVPDEQPDMNGGDSETELLLLRHGAEGYQPFQTLPVPGGEDAEFFRISERAFLAAASIRSGRGPYEFATDSRVFVWNGSRFEPFQSFPTFAAKQWRHFEIEGRHFLALAQGVTAPGGGADHQPSRIYQWDGARFAPFQDISSRWGYNWHAFQLDGHFFLAYADHAQPSVLYRWNGDAFEPYQDLADRGGRAFATFNADADSYLLVACLQDESPLFRWDGYKFVEHQSLDGLGAREFAVLRSERGLYVVRVNHVLGTPSDPTTALDSQLYQWRNRRLVVVQEFPTTGGTDVAVIADQNGPLVAVSNGLSADVRFAARTVLYRFVADPAAVGP